MSYTPSASFWSALGQGSLAGNYASQANAYYSRPETEEEREARIKREEEEQLAREQEKQQKIDKAIHYFVLAICCAGFTALVVASNCNLKVHDYNTAIVSSILWGLGVCGCGFMVLFSALGCSSIP